MKIAKEANPVLSFILLAIVTGLFFKISGDFGVFIALFFFLFTCYFFRDPDRPLPNNSKGIFSPADGTVIEVKPIEYEGEEYTYVAVFMSVFNVHINRVPFSGEVLSTDYRLGTFFPADKDEARAQNEQLAVVLKTAQGNIKFVQIAGLIARKIVCRLQKGQQVTTGEKFGLIKFGSRMDIYFPATAKCLVVPGQKVQGGITLLADFE
jgi:phosphatidylserine decarboxylase